MKGKRVVFKSPLLAGGNYSGLGLRNVNFSARTFDGLKQE